MRGTAWVNAFQTVAVSAVRGDCRGRSSAPAWAASAQAMETLLASPATAPLLTRERVSPLYFFSYTFIPLSSIAFPHIAIFCLTAKRLGALQEDRSCSIRSACCSSGCRRCSLAWPPTRRATCRPSASKLEARSQLATAGPTLAPATSATASARQAAGDDVILRLVEGYAPPLLAALLAAAVMAAVMASDSQILALSTMFTEDVFALLRRQGTLRRSGAGAHRTPLRGRCSRWSPTSSRCGCRSRSSTSPRSTRLPATPRCRRCSSRRCSGAGAPSGARSPARVGRRRQWPPSPSSRPRFRRRHPGPRCPILAIGGAEIVTRAATGTMVFGLLPVVPMTLISAVLMIVVSLMTPRACPGQATLAKYFAG